VLLCAESFHEKAGGITFSETIGAPIDRSTLAKIAAAKNVEIRIGSYETKLTANDIGRIRLFVAAVR
jgi:hypothetical protein